MVPAIDRCDPGEHFAGRVAVVERLDPTDGGRTIVSPLEIAPSPFGGVKSDRDVVLQRLVGQFGDALAFAVSNGHS